MKSQINIRMSVHTKRQLDQLTARMGTSITETITVAVERLAQQELQTMSTATTIHISTGTYTLAELTRLVATASTRGEWQDGPNSTHLSDWLAEGDYSGDETVESLAAEWDAE